MSMKNSRDAIGNLTGCHPARIIVPRPNAPRRAPQIKGVGLNKIQAQFSVSFYVQMFFIVCHFFGTENFDLSF
jgi:hypothetical protein